MIKLKDKINKTQLFKDIQQEANIMYKNSWESNYAIEKFMEGVKYLFDKLKDKN